MEERAHTRNKKHIWTQQEDKQLLEVVTRLGPHRWDVIASHFESGRTGIQCRERWYCHVSPDIVKEKFTAEEDAKLIELVSKRGACWSMLAEEFKGRPQSALKNRFVVLVRRGKTPPPPSWKTALVNSTSHDSPVSTFSCNSEIGMTERDRTADRSKKIASLKHGRSESRGDGNCPGTNPKMMRTSKRRLCSRELEDTVEAEVFFGTTRRTSSNADDDRLQLGPDIHNSQSLLPGSHVTEICESSSFGTHWDDCQSTDEQVSHQQVMYPSHYDAPDSRSPLSINHHTLNSASMQNCTHSNCSGAESAETNSLQYHTPCYASTSSVSVESVASHTCNNLNRSYNDNDAEHECPTSVSSSASGFASLWEHHVINYIDHDGRSGIHTPSTQAGLASDDNNRSPCSSQRVSWIHAQCQPRAVSRWQQRAHSMASCLSASIHLPSDDDCHASSDYAVAPSMTRTQRYEGTTVTFLPSFRELVHGIDQRTTIALP